MERLPGYIRFEAFVGVRWEVQVQVPRTGVPGASIVLVVISLAET